MAVRADELLDVVERRAVADRKAPGGTVVVGVGTARGESRLRLFAHGPYSIVSLDRRFLGGDSRMDLGTGRVEANGLTFHYLEAGRGPLVLCLHGFPDNAHTYGDLLPALAKAGFLGVAPFMRGYAPTSLAP